MRDLFPPRKTVHSTLNPTAVASRHLAQTPGIFSEFQVIEIQHHHPSIAVIFLTSFFKTPGFYQALQHQQGMLHNVPRQLFWCLPFPYEPNRQYLTASTCDCQPKGFLQRGCMLRLQKGSTGSVWMGGKHPSSHDGSSW